MQRVRRGEEAMELSATKRGGRGVGGAAGVIPPSLFVLTESFEGEGAEAARDSESEESSA
jgi:hypothetical protein